MIPSFLSLADADDIFTVAMPDGAVLPVYGLNGVEGAPALLFGHANGMAAGSYGPFLRLLAARTRVWAFDARGHGGSSWPDGPLDEVFAVDRMADDLAQVTRAVATRAGVQRIACVGHSLGAAAALRLAMLGRAPRWSALVAIEPPIFPPPGAAVHDEAVAKQARLVAGTAKRRTHWPSPEALAERLAGRGMFARFDRAMLEAHCRATLRPAPEGGFRLCCPPAVESFIFRSHGEADSWARLSAIEERVALIGGDPTTPDNDWVSSVLPEMAAQMRHARLTMVPGTGHLLVSEVPARCAALVLDQIKA
ncbi:MAG TPA: alpha/beta hydrolase [Stellaceae bacterium]|nr:alpha/beta hydrolase [Stellaceae bacterium]